LQGAAAENPIHHGSRELIILRLHKRRSLQLTGEEANAAAVGFLVNADKEDGADLEREEAEAVYIASEGGVVDALDALRV